MRARRLSLVVLTLLLLSGLSFLGSPVVPKAYAQLEILPGFDLFETDSATTEFSAISFAGVPLIPPDFFDPGSDPFSGRICLQGVPLDPALKGATDTVVQRLAPMDPLLDGPPATVPIELVGLSLMSCAPITVTYSGGGTELWDVRVSLSDVAPQPMGGMSVTKTHPNGGTFDSVLFVQPLFTFTRIGNPLERIFDCATPTSPCQYQFQTQLAPWTYEPCHPEILRVPGLTSNFCPSATETGRVTTMATDGFSTHTYLPTLADLDGDGVADFRDNCPNTSNTDQADNDGDGVGDACDPGICGDGNLDPGEQCDDGNNVDGDGCSAMCKEEFCGDGVLQPGFEECEDGNTVDGDGCSAECKVEFCGDGVLQPGSEECDDGNNADGDGCSAECVEEFCGDGIVQPPELCDDGGNASGDGCSDVCVIEFCGDGILHPLLGEVCDDGNNTSGDGCDASCQTEEPVGPTCNGLTPTIIGTVGDDHLVGTSGDDVIVGLEGNDKIEGRQGNDVLCGNEGDDDLVGGQGDDQLFGDSGDDDLKGQEGEDVACGGADDDRLKGGAGADRMDGGADEDKMKGGGGSDICVNGESLSSCEDTTTPVPECSP